MRTGATTTLNGGGSSDANGDVLTYRWSFTSRPDGSAAALSSPTVVNPTFVPDIDGVYVLTLAVNDGKADSTTDTVTITASPASSWTWVSGSAAAGQRGTYGLQGVADAANVPGAREYAASWRDGSGSLWLFGGLGYGSGDMSGFLNDLWKFDGANWTWAGGFNTANHAGRSGTKGVADAANVPGARNGTAFWKDSSGNAWLFGGFGFDSAGVTGFLSDLWKFDGTNWTWVSGPSTANQAGVYGDQGVAGADNVPGARKHAVSWTDSSGNLWLFGGEGIGGNFNDLWKFDGSHWTWVRGSDTTNQSGTYGQKNVAEAANVPGARGSGNTASWTDAADDLWLFGGALADGTRYNDLWKFDGTYWTWVSGATTTNQAGTYGAQGVADPANVPGARNNALSWTDSFGNLWLFGGYGYAAASSGHLNDLWKFDGTSWTWVSGPDTADDAGVYGTKGVADIANIPPSRASASSWIDSSGNLWLFGGHDNSFTIVNDLWRYQP